MKNYYLFLNYLQFFNEEDFEKRERFNWFTLDELKYKDEYQDFRKELATRNIANVITAATFTLYDYDNLYDMHIEPINFGAGLEYHLVLNEEELNELQEIAILEFPPHERY